MRTEADEQLEKAREHVNEALKIVSDLYTTSIVGGGPYGTTYFKDGYLRQVFEGVRDAAESFNTPGY